MGSFSRHMFLWLKILYIYCFTTGRGIRSLIRNSNRCWNLFMLYQACRIYSILSSLLLKEDEKHTDKVNYCPWVHIFHSLFWGEIFGRKCHKSCRIGFSYDRSACDRKTDLSLIGQLNFLSKATIFFDVLWINILM